MVDKLLGNLSKGLIFVLSAPAGTGKTTLVRMLRDNLIVSLKASLVRQDRREQGRF